MVIEKIKPYIEALPENKTPDNGLRMSSAGDCPRLMDYEEQFGKKPIDFASYMRMETGHAFHYLLQGVFSKALGDDLYDCEKEITITTPGGHRVPGHADGRIRSAKATLEIKSVSENTFQMIKEQSKPLDAHIDQGNMYAHTVGDEWIVVLYINRNTGEFLEFMFESSKDLANQIMAKWDKRKENAKTKILTPRPYTDKTGSPCWFCDYKDLCYADFKDTVKRMSKAVVTDIKALEFARNAITHRNSRLVSTKLEDVAKESLGKLLYGYNLREAEMSDDKGKMSVEIKTGKNDNLLTTIREME